MLCVWNQDPMEIKSCFKNSRMLKRNGSWIYCEKCNKTVAYLCYSTYQHFNLKFSCNCGARGSIEIEHPSAKKSELSSAGLKRNKNRLCCPNDDAPLFSIVEKHIKGCSYSVTCNKCFNSYMVKQKAT